MSLQGPIVVVAEKPSPALVQAFTAAGAFPVVETRWADAGSAIASIKPTAVVLAEAHAPGESLVRALADRVAANEPYLPVVACTREGCGPILPNALPVPEEASPSPLIARLATALRLRALHATVIGRAHTLRRERNIIAEFPTGDPIDDATVLVVGRGRQHPVLSVAVGEHMGVVGAMSVDLAVRCLNARDFDGVVIGDGLSPKMIVTLLSVLGQDSRFRDLPVGLLGVEEQVEELPNLLTAQNPKILIERMLPLVRQRAFEAQLKRLLTSIESKGMLDARTGLLNVEAFGRDLDRAIKDASEHGVGLSVARFSFDEAIDLRTSMNAAQLVSRLLRKADFACRQDDGSIVAAFAGSDLRSAHVVARRLASVIKHTLFQPGRGGHSGRADVTLAAFKPGDTPITLMARVAPRTVAAE